MKAVELGGGENPRYRPNVDCRPLPTVDIVANFEEPLPLPSEEFDLVYSSYVIEHISWRKVRQFIKEIYRILKPGGKAEIVTANLLEQCRVVVNSQEFNDKLVCMIFGDQDYPENTHKCGFSPEYAIKLFKEAGFQRVEVVPHPNCPTDMIIYAYKEGEEKPLSEIFNREYFEDGTTGYHFYRNFPSNYKVAEIILERKPESVLDLGGARGYICKLLENHGVRAVCLDVSKHCWHTRATDNFVLWDATNVPWPFKDKEFDLCFSLAFLEHIPEEKLDLVIKEMARVCRRGLHGITFTKTPEDIDKTHKTIRPKEWWIEKFKSVAPDFPVEIMDKEDMTKGPLFVPPADGLVKLNIGCFMDQYHYGWENWDILDLSEWAKQNGYIFRQVDVTKGIPKPDESVDIILASHFIEHLTRDEGLNFLKECFRVLKPGGIIRLAVPDTQLLCEKYLNGEIMEYRHVNVGVEKAKDEAEALFHLLLAGHKTIYDFNSLKRMLEEVGFTDVEKVPFNKSRSEVIEKQTIGMYPTLTLYVEATKPILKTDVTSKARGFGRRLKIALISTPFLTTPPRAYGGLEQIVADLGECLAKEHDVTIFAANGSKVKGCEVVECGEPIERVQVNWIEAERRMFQVYKDQLRDFDIIHGHNWFGFEYAAKASNPSLKVIHTHHGALLLDWWKRSPPPFRLNLVAISRWMQSIYESQGFSSRVVYNGVNLERYPFKKQKGDRLLFVGRIDRFKQPHIAIEVARRLNMGLDIVGGTFVQDPAYLEQIRNMCDGEQIKFYPDAPHEVKVQLMQNARCLLFPSAMGEPFGLVPIEAMACGTPIIALNDGAVEEVVQEGGIVCDVYDKHITPNGPFYNLKRDPIEAICEALKVVDKIKPEDCRRNAERFSREYMAKNYLELYEKVLKGEEW